MVAGRDQSMRTTNGLAAQIGMAHRPRAGTDVTGFGLAGHLREMLDASNVAAVLQLDAIPALPGARALAAHGIQSSLARQSALAGGRAGTALLVDPQTSGGFCWDFPHPVPPAVWRPCAMRDQCRDHRRDRARKGWLKPYSAGLEHFRPNRKCSNSYFASNFIGLKSLRDFWSSRYCSRRLSACGCDHQSERRRPAHDTKRRERRLLSQTADAELGLVNKVGAQIATSCWNRASTGWLTPSA